MEIATISPIIGLFAGSIIGKLAESELKTGKKYFRILQHALIGLIVVALFWNVRTLAIIGGVIVFVLLWSTEFKHPLILSSLLSIPAVIATRTQIPIFLYFIPTGTLNNIKKTTIAAAIYIIIALGYHLFF